MSYSLVASRLLGVDFIGDEMIINPHIKVNYGVTWSVIISLKLPSNQQTRNAGMWFKDPPSTP